jgi:hypothetical protein
MRMKAIQGNHYWAKAFVTWTTALTTYGRIFDMNDHLALAGVLLFGLVVAGTVYQWWRNPQQALVRGLPLPDMLLIGGLLLYPAVLAALAKVAGSVYTERYGWPAILALVLGSMFLAGSLWMKPVAAQVLVVLLAVFAFQLYGDLRGLLSPRPKSKEERWAKITQFSNANPSIPVALDSVDLYLEMTYYPAAELRGRIVRVVNRDAAVRFAGNDTSEVIHTQLGPVLSWHVEDSESFLAAHKRFLVQSDKSKDSWLLPYLLEKNYHVTLLWEDPSSMVSLVEE